MNCIHSSSFIELRSKKLQSEIETHFSNNFGGRPIQVYLLNSNNWTTVGTEKLISKHLNNIAEITFTEVLLDEIEHTIAEDKRVKLLEPSIESALTITLKTEQTVKVPIRASDIFQLWNILLMLRQLQR